jgi:hypothetical protein
MTTSTAARSIIAGHLADTAQDQGFSAPELLLAYLTDLVADRLTQTEIIPEPSFAERYLSLYRSVRVSDIRDFADQCLFFCSLMPEYGSKRGLGLDYYGSLGISAYYTVGDLTRDSRFTQLGNWFYHLQRFLDSALHRDQNLELVRF